MAENKTEIVNLPEGVQIFRESDDLGDVPEADQTGDQTGGKGPL